MSCYHHLTIEERESLLILKIQGHSVREMARRLGRSPSTISRELRRNPPDYSPSHAQRSYCRNRRACVRKSRLSDQSLNLTVRFFLTYLYWSPEQICERLRLEARHCVVGMSTIYRALDNGLLRDTVRYYLRRKYNKLGKNKKKHRKCFQKLITQRPPEAAARSRLGDWEGDTILGHNEKARLVTLVDRKTRYTLIGKVSSGEAAAVNEVIISLLQGHEARTITFDQGTEFAFAPQLEGKICDGIYFAHPRSPWERPTNENTNGLLRQFVPKRSHIDTLTDDDVRRFAANLNFRPRKCLDWICPFESFFAQVLRFT